MQSGFRSGPARRRLAALVLAWYDRHHRAMPWRVPPPVLKSAGRAAGARPDPYHVWLSEVMLQQTTVAAVGSYFATFTTRWPDLRALAGAPLEAVLAAWAGLGYYARARNLHRCAIAVAARLQGFSQGSIDIILPGGTLVIDWDGEGEVYLEGPAEEVFSGEWPV